jgi:hypothetical protein
MGLIHRVNENTGGLGGSALELSSFSPFLVVQLFASPVLLSFFFSDFPSSVDQLIPLTGRISDMQSLLSLTSLSLLVLPTVAQTGMVGTCYFANGTALPVDPIYNQYQLCQSGGPSTICCGIFRDNVAGGNVTAGDTMDECLPNGLCQNRATTTDGVEETK